MTVCFSETSVLRTSLHGANETQKTPYPHHPENLKSHKITSYLLLNTKSPQGSITKCSCWRSEIQAIAEHGTSSFRTCFFRDCIASKFVLRYFCFFLPSFYVLRSVCYTSTRLPGPLFLSAANSPVVQSAVD
jgi:hypothetical protein